MKCARRSEHMNWVKADREIVLDKCALFPSHHIQSNIVIMTIGVSTSFHWDVCVCVISKDLSYWTLRANLKGNESVLLQENPYPAKLYCLKTILVTILLNGLPIALCNQVHIQTYTNFAAMCQLCGQGFMESVTWIENICLTFEMPLGLNLLNFLSLSLRAQDTRPEIIFAYSTLRNTSTLTTSKIEMNGYFIDFFFRVMRLNWCTQKFAIHSHTNGAK